MTRPSHGHGMRAVDVDCAATVVDDTANDWLWAELPAEPIAGMALPVEPDRKVQGLPLLPPDIAATGS